MTPKEYDIAIVGAGFSGLAAANILSEHDLDILLIEESDRSGGLYLRTHPLGGGEAQNHNDLQKLGVEQMARLESSRVRLMTRTRVLGINDDKELLLEEDLERLYTLMPKIVILATGARERFVPFKGWTLPGVISTGAAQIMLKGSGVLPTENMMIAGSGLFLYTVAADVVSRGGRVESIFDESSVIQKMGMLGSLLGQRDKLKEGVGQLIRIAFSRTRIRHRYRILEACGDSRLEAVRAAKIDPDGLPIPGSESVYPCECLAVGNGFSANIELGLLAGCRPEYDPYMGGWIITTDKTLETSVNGIYAAGEVTGIGGALKSIVDGKLAAYAILHRFGIIDAQRYQDLVLPLKKEGSRHHLFARRFNALSNVSRNALKSIPDETILCRCEDITVGEVKDAIATGCRTPVAVKRALRTGMGICQGRICGPILSELIGACTTTPVEAQTPLSIRGPVKAVPLEVLAKPISRLRP